MEFITIKFIIVHEENTIWNNDSTAMGTWESVEPLWNEPMTVKITTKTAVAGAAIVVEATSTQLEHNQQQQQKTRQENCHQMHLVIFNDDDCDQRRLGLMNNTVNNSKQETINKIVEIYTIMQPL